MQKTETLGLVQLMHLQKFFEIKETQGTKAALEWAEGVIEENSADEKKPHLTLVE